MSPDVRKGIAKAEEKKTEAELEKKKSEALIKAREEKKKKKEEKKSSSSKAKKDDDDHITGVAKPQDHVRRGKVFQFGKTSSSPIGNGTCLLNGMNGLRLKRDEAQRLLGTMTMCMTSTRERHSLLQLCMMPDPMFMNLVTRAETFIHFHVCRAFNNLTIIEIRSPLVMVASISTRCSTRQ
jgi:hypothetical protein